MTLSATASNPLLLDQTLPAYDQITTAHVVPAVRARIATMQRAFAKIEAALDASPEPTWQQSVGALDALSRDFERVWNPVTNLMGVMNSQELRDAFESVQGEVVALGLRMGQSPSVLRAMQALDTRADLTPAQRRIVQARLRDARHAGVALQAAERERFNALCADLSALQTQFSNHVLDATNAWHLDIEDASRVDAMPKTSRQMMAAAYAAAHDDAEANADAGPWRVTLAGPVLIAFLEHCPDRALRQRVYTAYANRASAEPYNNTPLIRQILTLRAEKAALLGYESFAELSTASKMATPDQAFELLHTLRDAAAEAGRAELRQMQAFANQHGHDGALAPHDLAFWRERLREDRFELSDEELRPYFQFPVVLQGLFDLVERIFRVTVREGSDAVARWHKDVRYFEVFDRAGARIAGFFIDPYARPQTKRPGAWMADAVVRRRIDGALDLPVAVLVCNGTPPVDGRPSLMTFSEVETLFHEFGHGLQHMLSTVDFGDVSGINGVEWDAVELPSQFMENWCYHRETLLGLTRHVDTGATLPDPLFEKIRAARTFGAGNAMLRQVCFSLCDLTLHSTRPPTDDTAAHACYEAIAAQTLQTPYPVPSRFLCAFGHIFAGGYAAGYFSYKWAEVLSADAFGAFEDAGLDDAEAVAAVGLRFRDTVLALGGSLAPAQVFKAFRGRAPSADALLRHSGLSV